MMKLRLFAALVLGIVFSSSAVAADASRGEKLHNEQCTRCHAQMFGGNGDGIYTRSDRRVTSYEGLQKQVDRCKNNLSIVWFDEDVADVVEYLNNTFYHFKKAP